MKSKQEVEEELKSMQFIELQYEGYTIVLTDFKVEVKENQKGKKQGNNVIRSKNFCVFNDMLLLFGNIY